MRDNIAGSNGISPAFNEANRPSVQRDKVGLAG
jgi:hypothetical protein